MSGNPRAAGPSDRDTGYRRIMAFEKDFAEPEPVPRSVLETGGATEDVATDLGLGLVDTECFSVWLAQSGGNTTSTL